MSNLPSSPDDRAAQLVHRAYQLQRITKEICSRPVHIQRVFYLRIVFAPIEATMRKFLLGIAALAVLLLAAILIVVRPLPELLILWVGIIIGVCITLVLLLIYLFRS